MRLAEQEHVLLVTHAPHRLRRLVDGGAGAGAGRAVRGVLRGEDDPLPPLAMQYADYAVWQRQWLEGERAGAAGASTGEQTLAERRRCWSCRRIGRGRRSRTLRGHACAVVLDEELAAGLKELSRRQGTTLFMTLLAGWAAVLARLSGQAGRGDRDADGEPRRERRSEGLIGFFVNTLALRVDLSGEPTVAELLERVKAQALAAQQHQDVPFEQVVEIVQPARQPERTRPCSR